MKNQLINKNQIITRRKQFKPGKYVVKLVDIQLTEYTDKKNYYKLELEEVNENRIGNFNLPYSSNLLNYLLDAYGSNTDRIFLDQLKGCKYNVVLKQNGNFLNIVSIEAAEVRVNKMLGPYLQTHDEEEELDLDLDLDLDDDRNDDSDFYLDEDLDLDLD